MFVDNLCTEEAGKYCGYDGKEKIMHKSEKLFVAFF